LKQFQKTSELQSYLKTMGKSIGFVPTMGALHEGHLALIQASKSACEITVCSIFINPTQFNDPTDFEKVCMCFLSDV
jgi:pantoate--beta-alanine ligase